MAKKKTIWHLYFNNQHVFSGGVVACRNRARKLSDWITFGPGWRSHPEYAEGKMAVMFAEDDE